MIQKKYTTRSAKEMQARARLFAKEITGNGGGRTGALVIALDGDLGSGKTTFVQGFMRALGVRETITSPTFVIAKRYAAHMSNVSCCIHVDAYRLTRARELHSIGWRDMLKDTKTIVLVEWARNVQGALPKKHVRIVFEHADKNTRKMIMNYNQ